jgi:glycine betaine/proline transport system substrate-binding protein
MKQRLFLLLCVTILLQTACSSAGGLLGGSPERPGEGVSVRMARATWDTGWFQAEIFKALLEELGYDVREPIETIENLPLYFFTAQGDIDFWANAWFPIHERYLRYSKVSENVVPVGFQVRTGALQGYMVDKATAEELGITNLGDFKDPEIAAAFDHDGDGKADLIGCNVGWGCEIIIDHHLDVYGLRDTVSHVQGDYSELINETVARYESGQPVLFYTWTPNWTVSRMVIDEDINWLSVPFSALPDDSSANTAVTSIPGCLEIPCDMGFAPSDIRISANIDFLKENPAAAQLFEVVEIPLDDIAAQNVLMADGENTPEDIRQHALEWIEANRNQVNIWLEAARSAGN